MNYVSCRPKHTPLELSWMLDKKFHIWLIVFAQLSDYIVTNVKFMVNLMLGLDYMGLFVFPDGHHVRIFFRSAINSCNVLFRWHLTLTNHSCVIGKELQEIVNYGYRSIIEVGFVKLGEIIFEPNISFFFSTFGTQNYVKTWPNLYTVISDVWGCILQVTKRLY